MINRKSLYEMIEYCSSHNINSFSDLLDYAREYNPTWFDALCYDLNCETVIKDYIQSRNQKKE